MASCARRTENAGRVERLECISTTNAHPVRSPCSGHGHPSRKFGCEVVQNEFLAFPTNTRWDRSSLLDIVLFLPRHWPWLSARVYLDCCTQVET